MGGVACKPYKAVNNYTRNGILRVFYNVQVENYGGWLMVDSDYMLSRLVVSFITLNICGVRLLYLWLQCILLPV